MSGGVTQALERVQVDHEFALKKYHRPAAGEDIILPEEVRPPPVLRKAIEYMFTDLIDRTNVPFTQIQQVWLFC